MKNNSPTQKFYIYEKIKKKLKESKKRIIVSVTNDLVTDQRVHKISTTLTEMGFKVTLVGRKLRNSLPLKRNYQTVRMKLIFPRGGLFYAEYNIRLFLFLLYTKSDILLSNDLDTLLANYLASKIKGNKLVYDSHEYFTGVPEIANRPFVKKTWENIERWIFPKLETAYTVNNSISELYKTKHNKKIGIIRNISTKLTNKTTKTRNDLGLPSNKNIIILQGSGINVDRGAEEAVKAMQNVSNALFLIIGSGDVIDSLSQMVIDLKLEDKVWILGKLPFNELMEYTQNADLGLTLDKDTNINYRYSLPNKVFDYIQAGIPVLASNLVEVANIVKSYNIGEVIDNHEPETIAQKITEMLTNQEKRLLWKSNLKIASEELCWENESLKLKQIYQELC
nr:glycosyltransferase [uncultured Draconibacterium sp.]